MCEKCEGGLVGYLEWKISQFLEKDNEIDFVDLKENESDMDGIYYF